MTSLDDININDFTGVDTQVLQDMGSLDKPGYESVLASIKRRANMRFTQDVMAAITPSAKFIQRNSIKIGYTNFQDAKYLPFANKWQGIRLTLPDDNYAALYIHSIRVLSKFNATINLKVLDAITGQELFTKQETVQAGWNTTIAINKLIGYAIDTRYYLVLIDRSDVQLAGFQQNANCLDCSNDFKVWGVQYVSIDDINNVKPSTIKGDAGCFAINYSIKCDIEPFICENISTFATAYSYLLQIEIAAERLSSLRINASTAINVDGVSAEAKRNEQLYMQALKEAADSLQFTSGYCVSCNQQYQTIYKI